MENPKVPPGNRVTSNIWTERKTTFILMGQQGADNFPTGSNTPEFLTPHLRDLISMLKCHPGAGKDCFLYPTTVSSGLTVSGLPPCVGRATGALLRLHPPHTSLSQESGSTCGSTTRKKAPYAAWGGWVVPNRPSCLMWTDQGKSSVIWSE